MSSEISRPRTLLPNEKPAPVDNVERMLSEQMAGAHHAAMDCLARAACPDRSEEAAARDLRLGTRLLAIYSWQVRTLDVWQSKRGGTADVERLLISWLDTGRPTDMQVLPPDEVTPDATHRTVNPIDEPPGSA